MVHDVTISIRLPLNLRDELELTSHKLHRGKNWITIKALEAYLSKVNLSTFAEEARRQSKLASSSDTKESTGWVYNSDTSGWI
jgi:predicted DNA-binding protein